MTRLLEFEVYDLFGLYTHRIPLNLERRITGIIGPNGRGKTVCLKLVEALFNRKLSYFVETNFSRCAFRFDNGLNLEVTKSSIDEDMPEEEAKRNRKPLIFKLFTTGQELQTWNPVPVRVGRRQADIISNHLPFLTRIGARVWIDDNTGEELDLQSVIEVYSDYLPDSFYGAERAGEPKAFTQLLEEISCHLIETQRLLVISRSAEEMYMTTYRASRRGRPSTSLAINEKAEGLIRIIQKVLTDYATLSQSLDRTFPKRIIGQRGKALPQMEELRSELAELEKKRRDLMSAGILQTEIDPVDVYANEIDENVAGVLGIYIKDTTEKLNIFDNLLEKIQIFLEIINKRFIDKRIDIDRASGIVARSSTNDDIDLDKLSSGEQHQIVLMFDLLFNTQKNEIILIDEPELSLHVSWQKAFIEDMERIIGLNQFDVLFATHSPQLIGKHFDLAVELGNSE